jgi:hypothetical protein
VKVDNDIKKRRQALVNLKAIRAIVKDLAEGA